MVLAPELLAFAENFYRRFPEEFIALGAPGLEQTFDLRVDGTRSRRMSDTPTEKTVEITIRRWPYGQPPPQQGPYGQPPPQQMPYGAFPQQGMYPGMPSPIAQTAAPHPWASRPGFYPPQAGGPMPNDAAWGRGVPGAAPQPSHFGGAMPPGYGAGSQPPQQSQPAGPSAAEAQMASQLARLESALSSMMPQVAAMIQNQHQESIAPTNQYKPTPSVHFGGEQVTGLSIQTAPTVVTKRTPPSPKLDSPSPNSPLRERRNVGSLQVQPPTRVADKGAVKPETAVKPAVVDSTVEVMTQKVPAKVDTKKEKPRINAVRMMPNAADPESPRSPGRYSVWK